MHVISRAPFDEAARHYPNDAVAIDDTYRVLKRVVAKKPDELKRYFTSLDRMKYREKWWVIDIGGNRGLTLSGTKTHVKQRFLPLTPLLMVSDVLWSPVLPA